MQDLKKHLEIISQIKHKLVGKPGRLLYLMVSGSHLYGFTSRDSDIDYRGCYQIDTNKLLGLGKPKDTLIFDYKDNDVALFELSKVIGLALAGNCNVLEHLNAKQVVSTAEYVRLKQLINNCWGKTGIYNSYKGMAMQNYKKFILQGRNTVKKYLYVFRGLLAGTYALQTGQIEPNIDTLNKYFKIPEVKELIKLKIEGEEKGPVPLDLDTGALEDRINELFTRLDKAYEKSKIPLKPSDKDKNKVNEFLLGVRKDYI